MSNFLQAISKPLVACDRKQFLHLKANEAQVAAHGRDSRRTFAIVRQLAGLTTAPQVKSVRKADGSLAESEVERQERWQAHFAGVFHGKFVDKVSLVAASARDASDDASVDVSPPAVERSFRRLGRHKGVGLDRVPAELLQAGDGATAVHYSKLYARIVHEEQWPIRWAGGRIVDVFKRKGDPTDRDSSRGILLESHASKGLSNILASEVEPSYEQNMPECQNGAVKGKGTDFAGHVVKSLLDLATLASLSIFVLFIDLVKAFDRVIREIVFGFLEDVDDPLEYLLSLGLNDEQAHWYAQFVAVHGPLFLQWGVKPKVVRLLRNLHASSWFSYGDLDTAIVVRVGGRQGCKFGATVFNSSYAIALLALRDSLLSEGIVLRLQSCDDASFFGAGSNFEADSMFDSTEGSVPTLDAAFVDDEAIAILARSPCQLDKAVNTLLKHLVSICSRMRLDINWNPGKTEAFVRYRGRGATKRLELKRRPDGSLGVLVPGTTLSVNIVDKYKHLGGCVCSDANVQPEAVARARSATSAYVPIVMKVFGSSGLDVALKLVFLWALVMSRLLFNVHIIVPTPRFIKTVNFVYMRVLRRTAGCMRFKRCESDLEVRRRLKVPSMECLLARARLRYVRRIVLRKPRTLTALLAVRYKGKPLPWVALLLEDLRAVRSAIASCSMMPDPECDSGPWISLMHSGAKWSQMLGCFMYCEASIGAAQTLRSSVGNVPTAASEISGTGAVVSHGGYSCDTCNGIFTNAKALLAHQRAKHQQRVEQRFFSNLDGVCQVCGTVFHTHARLLRHLTDRRRTRCWTAIRTDPGNFIRQSPTQVSELDDWYRKQKALAFKTGHSHIISAKPARTSAGKMVGHVQH